jgi:lipoprotein-releasing system permease protein
VPFELFVALRFLREGRSQTLLILLGVSVGVAVIIFLSALINGLQSSLLDKTLGSQAHVTVRPNEEVARQLTPDGEVAVAAKVERSAQRARSIDQWQQVLSQIEQVPGVVAANPTVAGSAFAVRGTASRTVAVRGIDADRFETVIRIREKITSGQYRLQGTDIIIGVELAKDLGVAVNDRLRLTTPEGRAEIFTIAGVFDLGNKDVNERWVLIPLRAAQTLLDLVGGVSTIEVKTNEVFGAETIAQAISTRTGLVADSWMKMNAQLLVGLKSQDSSKWMIQFFVIVAVALGIASVLVVSVVQKSREIGILKAMGASTGRVMRVFLIQGAVVGVVGATMGSLMGAGLSIFFASMARNADGSPIFPVDLSPTLFLSAAAVALFTGLIAAVAPARRAAKLDPAVVIRYG